MALILAITTAGRAALRNAEASGTRAVRIASVGFSAAALAATAATAALPGEIKRITTVSGAAVAADIIHLTVSDETMTTYTVRSFALYLDDGTLFAAYGQADPIIEKSAQALMVLTMDVTLADITASQITFGDANFLMPPATVDRQGLIELATVAEAKAGEDQVRAVTPATAKGAVRDWIGYTPANRAGDTFTGAVAIRQGVRECGLRIAHADTGYGFVQLGEAATQAFNWHLGSQGDGTLALYQGNWGSGTLRMHVTSTAVAFNGAAMWHAGNDGAGSGLDADLLDGLQGTQLVRSDVSSQLAPNVSLQFFNSTFGRALRVGGDGYTIAGAGASVVTTNGNLHLDGATGYRVYLNHYAGDGVNFGNGAGTVVASMSKDGALIAAAVDAGIMRRGGANLVGFDNDGAGSGLDADLLDGQDGSWYGNIPARLGYTPANRAGDTFNGAVGIRLPNQLSGLHIAQVGSGFGFVQIGESGDTTRNWHVGSLGNGDFGIYQGNYGTGVRRLFVTNAALTFNDATVWTAGNDGAGSGLDADLLDGLQGAQFVRSDVSTAIGANAALDFVNTSWGRVLRIGGNGYTAGGSRASVVGTDGSLHLDAASGLHQYLNYYAGEAVHFGNGAGAVVATMSKAGALSAAAVDAPVMRRNGGTLVGFDNDGAGSGLDADLLDGQDGSWYGNIPARLGYTPVNRAGDTFNGAVAIRPAAQLPTLHLAQPGSGFGFIQIGESLDTTRNWHVGSTNAGDFGVYQGNYGTGARRLLVTNTALTFNEATVWTAGNDGAGSGLDADLLDGQDGSWYGNIPARLGYTPADRAGDTFTGPVSIRHGGIQCGLRVSQAGTGYGFVQLGEVADVSWHLGSNGDGTAVLYQGVWGSGVPRLYVSSTTISYNGGVMWHLGNDGAGSGLDADLLDGRQATDFALLAGANFADLTRSGNRVWDAGNDGAGSGLDADLLDGLQADQFSRVTAQSLTPTGYRVHADGFKECWGATVVGATRDTFIAFPTAHQAWCVPVGSSARPSADEANCGVFSVDIAGGGFTVRNRNTEAVTFYWHTRGV